MACLGIRAACRKELEIAQAGRPVSPRSGRPPREILSPFPRAQPPCGMTRWTPFVTLLAACLLGAGGALAQAGEKPAERRYELFSRGPVESSVLITQSDLEKIKLAEPVVISDDLVITHAGVGFFEREGKTGPLLFRSSAEIPLKTGQGFGWVVKVDSSQRQTEVVEKFTLPRQNGKWTVDPETTQISNDGLTATTTDRFNFWDFLWRVWTLEDGDPDGPHSFGLSVGGKSLADLKFNIVKK